MKKLLLTILLAAPFMANAQVANPEPASRIIISPITNGWTASATNETPTATPPGTFGGANQAIDENVSRVWATATNVTTGTLTVDMKQNTAIAGVWIRGRAAASTENPQNITIETFNGTTWTTATSIVFDNTAANNTYVDFTSIINCSQYRLVVNSNYGSTSRTTIVETSAYTYAAVDNTAYNRATWTATTTNQNGTQDGSKTIDRDIATYWSVGFNTAALPFPHEVIYDMGVAQPLNKISYVQRVYAADGRSITTGNLIFSNDPTFTTNIVTIPFSWNIVSTGSPQQFFPLGQTVTARYIKLSATGNSNNNDLGSTCLAEFRAHNDLTLPVTLNNDFTAKANGSQVNLSWSTSSEQNSASFDILRSFDATNFAKIGSVKAAGHSNTTKAYRFTDFSPLKGTNYYKLTQTDNDGTVNADSKWVSTAKVAGSDLGLLVSTTASTVEASVYSPKAGKGTLSVINVTGQKLGSTTVQLNEGYNKITVPANVGAGVVIVTLKTAEGTISKKAIK